MKATSMGFACLFSLLITLTGCKKNGDKETTETVRAEAATNIQVYPGNKRVKLTCKIDEASVKRCEIFWNSGRSSQPVDLSQVRNGSLTVFVNNLEEGTKELEVRTYSSSNTSSVAKITTKVYGDSYQKKLTTREIKESFFITGKDPILEWFNPEMNELATHVSYTNDGSVLQTLTVGTDMKLVTLASFKPSSTLSIQTLYLPEKDAIDTFRSTATTLPAPVYYASTATRNIILKSTLVNKVLMEKKESIIAGVEYAELKFEKKNGTPASVFIIEVDLKNDKLTLGTLMPNNTTQFALQPVKQMIEHKSTQEHQAIGGVNGDFFAWTGTPHGPVYLNGTAVKTTVMSDWRATFFAINKSGKPSIGYFDLLSASERDNIRDLIGGANRLAANGMAIRFGTTTLEPRTCIGFTKDDRVYMVVVDGRNSTHSVGMQMDEISLLMHSLGNVEAINLDGGGSSTMVLKNNTSNQLEIRNKYSDAVPRSVANGLSIIYNP